MNLSTDLSKSLSATSTSQEIQEASEPCHHCDRKGYISIRDCSGEIQREENCSFCGGLGIITMEKGLEMG